MTLVTLLPPSRPTLGLHLGKRQLYTISRAGPLPLDLRGHALAAAVHGHPIRGDAPSHRPRLTRRPALVGVQPSQALRVRRPGGTRPGVLSSPSALGADRSRGGVCLLRRPARRALRDFRGHFAPGQSRGDAPDQYRVPGTRGGAGLVHRDDGRFPASDPYIAPDEPRASTGEAHGDLLRLPGLEHRRPADPSGGPAAVPRVPPGRAVHVDVPALAALVDDARRPAGRLFLLGFGAACA